MSKKRRDMITIEETVDTRSTIQNLPPSCQWNNVEHFWKVCVKNGTPVLFESFKMHLKAMGWLEDQQKWVQGARHFGIPLEK